MKPIWKRFWLLIGLNSIISLIGAGLVWKLIGRDFNLHFGYFEMDFFNTLCGVFTISGFAIAIYQIAAIRNEQQIRLETTAEVKKSLFIDEARFELGRVSDKIFYLRFHILNDSPYNEPLIKHFISRIDELINTFSTLTMKQNNVQHELIKCDKCLTLLHEVENHFYKSLEENDYISIKRQYISSKLREVGQMTFNCLNV